MSDDDIRAQATIDAMRKVHSFLNMSIADVGSDAGFDEHVRGIVYALKESLRAEHVTLYLPSAESWIQDPIAPSQWVPFYSTRRLRESGERLSVVDIKDAGRIAAVVNRVGKGEPSAAFYGTPQDPPVARHAHLLGQEGLGPMWCFPITGASRDWKRPADRLIAVGTAVYRAGADIVPMPPEQLELWGHVAGRLIERAIWAERDQLVERSFGLLDMVDEDPRTEFDRICAAICGVMGFEASTILFEDHRMRALTVLGTTGINSPLPRSMWLYPRGHESCTGWVARNHQTLACDDATKNVHHKHTHLLEKVPEGAGRHFLASPVLSFGRTLLGVVRLRARKQANGSGWESLLTSVDVLRSENLAECLSPLLSLYKEARHNESSIERIRHDLDVPANMIRNSAGRMVRRWDSVFSRDPNEVLRRLSDIESLSEILLINSELMALTDSESVSLRPALVPMYGAFVVKLCKLLQPMADRKGLGRIVCRDSFTQAVPALYVDPRLIQIALYNIMQNAIKYSDPGADIHVVGKGRHTFEGRQWYGIEVHNWGLGVTEDEERMLFKKYYRSERAAERSASGVGLGLNTAMELARLHGGMVRLEHRKDPTVFSILLPAELEYEPPVSRLAAKEFSR